MPAFGSGRRAVILPIMQRGFEPYDRPQIEEKSAQQTISSIPSQIKIVWAHIILSCFTICKGDDDRSAL